MVNEEHGLISEIYIVDNCAEYLVGNKSLPHISLNFGCSIPATWIGIWYC